MRYHRPHAAALGFLAILAATLATAPAQAAPLTRQAPEQKKVLRTLPEEWAESLSWRCIGPANMGGRITSIAVYEADPCIYWIGTASGGLLKTTDNGIRYEHQFDHQASSSIGDVQVAQSDPEVVWVGTGEANPRNSVTWGSGVYKSTDGGETWKNMGLKKSFQIGRIAIHPTDPNIVYVGALGRLWGPNEERGVFKTTDGGKKWEKVLFIDEDTGVVDLRMHPSEPDTLLAATYQRRRDGFDTNDPAVKWGPGSGLHKTTDGGASWREITEGLPQGELGRMGLDYYRKDPSVVYMVLESDQIGEEPENAAWPGMRGEDAEVGARLTSITKDGPAEKAGLQEGDIVIALGEVTIHSSGDLTREIRQYLADDTVQIEVSRDRKSVVAEIAFTRRPKRTEEEDQDSSPWQRGSSRPFGASLGGQRENMHDQQGPQGHEYGGVYRSEDGGESWTRINSVNPRPMYYSQIRVDPSDDQYLYVLGTSLYRSKDRGASFAGDGGRSVHPDHHALWIDSRDGRHMILGNDGGIYVTHSRMDRWDHHNHVAIGQFYHATCDLTRDYKVYGGLQDNGSWGGPNLVRHARGPVNTDWFRVGGGDGFVCRVDANDPDQIYSESQGGSIGRMNLRTGESGYMRPRAPRGVRYRFNWNTPFLLSSHNSRIFYSAGNYVFRSLDRGQDLRAVSPEITLTDRGSATALAESPLEPDVLYAGTDDGALWATRDGGREWAYLRAEEELPAEEPEESPAEEAKEEEAAAEEPQEEEAAAEEPQEAPADPVSGTWEAQATGEQVAEGEGRFTFTLELTKEGEVTGTIQSEVGEGPIEEGSWNAGSKKLEFRFATDEFEVDFSGTIEGLEMKGEVMLGGGVISMAFEAVRTPPEGSAEAVEVEPRVEGQPPARSSRGERALSRVRRALGDEDEPAGPGMEELVPEPRWVSSIAASHHEEGRVYVTLDGHRSDDDEPYVLVSEDFGQSWASIRGNLPTSAGSTRVISEDPTNENFLLLGCEFSAWASVDRGQSWTELGGELPTVAIHDFALHPTANEVIAATHGRSLWILDAAPLRQMSEETVEADAWLYTPSPAIHWRSEPGRGSSGNRSFVGENPPSGAQIYYSLRKKARSVKLEITDLGGNSLRELEASVERGLHRVSWDLRALPSEEESAAPQEGRRWRSRRGRQVEPGKVLVVLTVNGETQTRQLVIEMDPDHRDGSWRGFEERVEADSPDEPIR